MVFFPQVVWDWIILALTFFTVIMVPYNLAVSKSFPNENITIFVIDSIVDVIFFIDIIFNFHTSFVGTDGSVIVEEAKIRHEAMFIPFEGLVLTREWPNRSKGSVEPGWVAIFGSVSGLENQILWIFYSKDTFLL